jgi:hypothetical protein
MAFALYTCDHEMISWVAINVGISGEMIRDLMPEDIGREPTDRALTHIRSNGSRERVADTALTRHRAHSIDQAPSALDAGPIAAIQRNGRVLRQDAQASLQLGSSPPRYTDYF